MKGNPYGIYVGGPDMLLAKGRTDFALEVACFISFPSPSSLVFFSLRLLFFLLFFFFLDFLP